jgi:hypothetical protein
MFLSGGLFSTLVTSAILCDHSKTAEPTPDQVNDLIAGVTKVSKTLF